MEISRLHRSLMGISNDLQGSLVHGSIGNYVCVDLRESVEISEITWRDKKQRRKEELYLICYTNLEKEIITSCLNGLHCVCVSVRKISHVNLYMTQRNVFKVYKKTTAFVRNVAKWGHVFGHVLEMFPQTDPLTKKMHKSWTVEPY